MIVDFLTPFAVIPSVTEGIAKMQKTVSPSPFQSMDSETGGQDGWL